ncbi:MULTISPECIES: prepilin peptidase-dependent protein [Dickeya]|uniref:FIG004819: Prepilin peptidase dependent protein B n=1 Tax=Dickeya aquatica TaxID=1401087 RepID=A0A375ADU6_9GAMM|nr:MULTISPECIES: prepilin peptidase-dependent protein [Dickeya]SLM64167.1 FIG004819: Prepilin peptidase dependent protein B precursor [Dickeya aquatica]
MLSHLRRGAAGFTLPEMMLAMAAGSLVMLSVAQILPLLRARIQENTSQLRLEQLFNQVMLGIEKDIRRAGFCHGDCQGRALTLQLDGEGQVSCLSLTYDVNRNGRWESGADADPEFFSYRLRENALEVQTGGPACQGNRWEKLLDPAEVIITQFRVLPLSSGVLPRYRLLLEGYWVGRAGKRWRSESLVTGRNHAR